MARLAGAGRVLTLFVGLRLDEPLQHLAAAPPRQRPVVVVLGGAAVVQRGVGAGAAAQQLAAG